MANKIIKNGIEEFQELIGYKFKDPQLLLLALSHSSYANEESMSHGIMKNEFHNERLEFLGDAVLELATSRYIYLTHPDMREGAMSKLRASIVCEPTLNVCAKRIDFQDYILLGRGEESTGGRGRPSIISDAFEAVIGALYLDGGIDAALKFINDYILNDIDNLTLFHDSKTALQECMQAYGHMVEYTDVAEEGPAHAKVFTVRAECKGYFNVCASGHTKKSAQQDCAYRALLILQEKGLFPISKGK